MSGGAMYDDSSYDDASDGLLSLATRAAGLAGGPVTIENDASELITYSPGQENSDDARVATILSRRVPDRYRTLLRTEHLDERLAGSSGPFYADLRGAGILPRAIMPIRAGDTAIGSIWAIVPSSPSPEQRAALEESAALIAPLLARRAERRMAADARRTAAVRALLRGGDEAAETAHELSLAPGPLAVVAVRPLPSGLPPAPGPASPGPYDGGPYDGGPYDGASDGPSGDPLRRALADLDRRLSAFRPGGLSAEVDGVGYAVVPVGDEQRLLRAVGELPGTAAGVGRTVPGPGRLGRSRADAELVVRLLTRLGAAARTAHIRDVQLDALLMRTVDLAVEAGHDPLGALAELEDYDRRRGTALLDSVDRYLAAGADARLAARQLHVHPNTLRYRLRRAQEITGLDLSDPAAAFDIRLRLRLRALRLP
ncbi:helix-turn-helix domain-containing protein [Streptomyces sp. PRKS01-29]|nr:helix-turn-helix domain-containing protein [Streptomyces sabulosicollis]MBI0300426.1 helix-turn-helix domain-containing protein [Streptomyces sabulosicollis]